MTGPTPRAVRAEAGGGVLVTGGAGFIGTNLAASLLEGGRRVVVLDNFSRDGVAGNAAWLRRRYGPRVQIIEGDVREARTVEDALDGIGHVCHLAAQVAVTTSLDRPLEDFDVNARGTLTLLEALRRRPGVSLLFTSTNKVYGALHDVGLTCDGRRYAPTDPDVRAHGVSEARPLAFHSPYGCSKGAADQYVLDYARTFGLPAAVFRMSCIYGPHQFGTEAQGWVAHFLIRALAGAPLTIYGDGCQVRDLLFVGDLVAAMHAAEAAMPQLAGEAFNIGGGPERAVSLLDMLDLATGALGRETRCRFDAWRAADQRFYVSDCRKFSEATGWRPAVGVPDGLLRLADWLRTSRDAPAAARMTT